MTVSIAVDWRMVNKLRDMGLTVMYARDVGSHYESWQYFGDGRMSALPDFYTLQGLQSWSKQNGYGIIYK